MYNRLLEEKFAACVLARQINLSCKQNGCLQPYVHKATTLNKTYMNKRNLICMHV